MTLLRHRGQYVQPRTGTLLAQAGFDPVPRSFQNLLLHRSDPCSWTLGNPPRLPASERSPSRIGGEYPATPWFRQLRSLVQPDVSLKGGLHGGDEGGGGREPRGGADATAPDSGSLRRGAAGFAGEEPAGRREARAGRALRPARDSCRARQRLRMMRTSSSSVRIWRMICRLWLTSSFASSPESR